ncbi:MAG: hypothetical protein DRG11_03625 [Epsilonproteobacteria bacterium]|nr:MAG: hypothetical protein DRG11_03625 [Campylobacterota bacterium]
MKTQEQLLNHRMLVIVYTFFTIAVSSGTIRLITKNTTMLVLDIVLFFIGIGVSIWLLWSLIGEIVKISKITKELK